MTDNTTKTDKVHTAPSKAHQHSDLMNRAHDPFAIKHYNAEALKYEAAFVSLIEMPDGRLMGVREADPRLAASLELKAKVARLCVLAFETKDRKEIGCALTLRSEVHQYAEIMDKHRAKEAKQ